MLYFIAIPFLLIAVWGLFWLALDIYYKAEGSKKDPKGHDRGLALMMFLYPFLAFYAWVREKLKL